MRARMALAYADIKVELREISLRDRPRELYEVSSKGTVPVLITTDNSVIDESLEIMIWSLKCKENQTWLINESNVEFDLITDNDTTFKKWLDRYKYHDRYPEKSKEYYREHCNDILSIYEKQLNKTEYLLRNNISIADIAIFPFIRQFSNVDYEWFEKKYNKLRLWLKNISSSDLFISVMEKNDTWEKGSNPQIINFND